jgi:uncharacterized membrane protein
MLAESTLVLVGTFSDEYGATAALEGLKSGQKDGRFRIDDAAVLHRGADGTLKITEVYGDMHGGKGALIGGVSGAVVGLLTGPVGWLAGIGALAGGLAAKLRDSGFKDDRLRKLGDSLTPGTSVIVVVAEGAGFDEVEKYLANAGATILTEQIRNDVADQLQSGRDIAYSALVYAGAVETGRVESAMVSSAGTSDSGPAVVAVAGSEETGAPGA